ncbi:MAG: hypothetical protein HQ510_10815 [Candidatus Marinimicrobia bacterium]|nr:hypothetical protein [Candidatus Neomarinimicrobiota bacterium]
MSADIITIIDLYIKLIAKILKKVNVKYRRIRVRPLEFELKNEPETSYEKTLEQIETTKEHLNDAISSVDNLKNEFMDKKKELDNIVNNIISKQKEKENIDEKFELTQRLLAEESSNLKEVLGVNKIKESSSDKVAGFVGGVIASLVAAAIFTGVQLLF